MKRFFLVHVTKRVQLIDSIGIEADSPEEAEAIVDRMVGEDDRNVAHHFQWEEEPGFDTEYEVEEYDP